MRIFNYRFWPDVLSGLRTALQTLKIQVSATVGLLAQHPIHSFVH